MKKGIVFCVSCLWSLGAGCASQDLVTVFEQLDSAGARTAVVYNFAYATRRNAGDAAVRGETKLATGRWTIGESFMTIPGETFEVEPPPAGERTLTGNLRAADADVVWVRRALPQLEALLDDDGAWVGKTHFWDIAYEEMIQAYGKQEVQQEEFGLVAVEPSFAAEHAGYLEEALAYLTGLAEGPGQGTQGPSTLVVEGPSPVWPSREASWHLAAGYSELSAAQAALKERVPTLHGVKIAHLDTGYYPGDRLKPRQMVEPGKCFVSGESPGGDLSGAESSHGARTVSTLAGGRATVVDAAGATVFDGDIGAFPEARVAEYRISRTLPIHINAGRMAQAIVTAADEGYEVVTISAGGVPSLAQRDAVNHAYRKGTAIIAASGDFIKAPFGPSSPKSLVFPARFNRVLGVAGVTADGKSYGLDPCYGCLLKSGAWKAWGLRGSYGPAIEMAGHTLCGYAPNITHSAGTASNPNAIAHTGAGTSHATPQVAAAAAMWLEYHYDDLQGVRGSWRQTEAVYTALLDSADSSPKDYAVETMGAGTLKARRALETPVDLQALCERESTTAGLAWLKNAAFRGGVPGGHDERLAALLKEMLFTELQQLMPLSETVTEVLGELRSAKAAGSCNRYVLQSQPGDDQRARRVVRSLLKLKMSQRLRETLQASLQSLPA